MWMTGQLLKGTKENTQTFTLILYNGKNYSK